MSQSPQGWYEDDDAPGLARWWDGERWTEHTMVLPTPPDEDDLGYFAAAPDIVEPLPPRTGPTRFPRPGAEPPAPAPPVAPAAAASPIAPGRNDPTVVGTHALGSLDVGELGAGSFGDVDDTDNPFFAPEPALEAGLYRQGWMAADGPAPRHRSGASDGASDRFATRYRGWPLWARIAAPVLAVALMVGLAVAAAGSTGSGGGGSSNTTVATSSVPSSTTTAVTFVPLGPPDSVVVDSTVPTTPTTSTTAPRSTGAAAPTTVKPTTTTAAPTTTASSTTTTSSTTSSTTTTAP